MKKTMILAFLTIGLTACQTLPTSVSNFNTSVSHENSKQLLTKAIEKTLYRNQDFIAEHQLYLAKNEKNTATETTTAVDAMSLCQETHDEQFVKQMQSDKIKSYADVATLSPKIQAVYEKIKKDYLACINNYYENLAKVDGEVLATPEENFLIDSSENLDKVETNKPLAELMDISQIFGLKDEQVQSLNNFVSKSGKITVTGNYRPLSGYLAVQLDGSFENKNLKYHYRLPLVANWKKQSIFVKPDVIMPMVALYLDNQMGMSWQGKWYQFSQKDKQMPVDIATKNWLLAVKDGFLLLPDSQFEQISLQDFSPNIAYAKQKIAVNGMVIHWQQNAKQQQTLYTDIVNRYIQLMDESFEKQGKTPESWQEKRQKLSEFVEKRWISEPDEQHRLTGQDIYFVLDNQQLKQIYATNTANFISQPLQIRSWITFNPDNKLIEPMNTPAHLQTIVNTLNDKNVIDGGTEVARIRGLDKSRRLFGKDPDWLTSYENYVAESKRKKYCQAIKQRLEKSDTCPIFSNPNSPNIETLCEKNDDYQEYQDLCQD